MPASSAARPRRRRQDHPLITIAWLAAAATLWWGVQPGGVIPYSYLLLAVLWPGLLICAALRARSGWMLLGVTWLAFAIAWFFTLGWVADVTTAGWPALAAYSALYPAVLAVTIRWWCRDGRLKGLRLVPVSILAAVLGVALEYLRAEVIFDAWPFHLAGHALWDSPHVGIASIGGVWACSLIVWSIGGLIGACLACLPGWRFWPEVAAPIVFVMAGQVATNLTADPLDGESLQVLAVQTNLPQDNKIGWPLDRQRADMDTFLALTAEGLAHAGDIDLIVWPETMVPGFGFDPETVSALEQWIAVDAFNFAPLLIRDAAAETDIPWLVGSPTWTDPVVDEEGITLTRRFNSGVLVDPSGDLQRYDKVFLTPFGETLPYVRGWPWLERLVLKLGAEGMHFNLTPGTDSVRLVLETESGDSWRLATPICFEDAVPSVTRALCVTDGRTDVDAIVNISNDGWFGDSDAGRRSHEVAAGFRAVELGRPILRVANTGLTSLILPDGTVVSRLDAREPGTLVVAIPRYEGTTLQAAWGNWLPRTCLVLSFAGVLIRLGRRRSGAGLSSPP